MGKKKMCENLLQQKIHPQLLKKIRTKHKQIQKYGTLIAGIQEVWKIRKGNEITKSNYPF